MRWLNEGPVTKDWQQPPSRPFINLEPVNELGDPFQNQPRLNADDARRSLFWSLLNAPTAGVTSSENLGPAATFFGSFDFSQLRPSPGSVVNNPGVQNPRKFIALARTEKKDVTIAYVPEDRTVEILLEAFPPAPDVRWFNPRTGEKSPAVGVVTERSCQFPTPGEGDWILIMHTQQKPAVAPGPAK